MCAGTQPVESSDWLGKASIDEPLWSEDEISRIFDAWRLSGKVVSSNIQNGLILGSAYGILLELWQSPSRQASSLMTRSSHSLSLPPEVLSDQK